VIFIWTKMASKETSNGSNSASSSVSPSRKKVGMKDPLEDITPEQYRKMYPVGFLSSEVLASTWIFKLFYFWFWTCSEWMYGMEIKGAENMDGLKNWFSVGMHSTHNADIFVGLMANWKAKKVIGRGFMHRIIFRFNPWVANLGLLPGYRNAVADMLKNGYVCGVLPGGGEEAMYGHEHAYDLHPKWQERRGWVKVVREAKVPIIPWCIRNVEEMRFNILFFLFNYFGLSKFYTERLMTLPGVAGWFFKQLGMYVWFTLAWTGIPVPVKLTMYIGKPIVPDWDNENDDQIAEKARVTLQNMINEVQPHKHSYLPGLIERFDYLVKKQLPKVIAVPIMNFLGMKADDKQKTN
jgi:hypothetical protein